MSVQLYGTDGPDKLVGATDETLIGQKGDDVFEARTPNVAIREDADGGHDQVIAWGRFTLPANVEDLTMTGHDAYGAGNELANFIRSNGWSNTIVGFGGDDTLIEAGSGSTTFVFSRGSGHDVVQGFGAVAGAQHDFLELTNYGFTSFAQVRAALSQQGQDVLLTLSPTDSVTLQSVKLSDLTADDFLLQAPAAPRTLAFSDDFNSLSLYNPDTNTGTWKTNYWYGAQTPGDDASSRIGGPQEQVMAVDPFYHVGSGQPLGLNPFSVQDGVVSLTVARAPDSALPYLHGLQYTAGILTTEKTSYQTYGYYEISAKVPGDKGLWPALWLLPEDNGPQEIDILEGVGDGGAYETAHSATLSGGAKTFPTWFPQETDGQFHTYGLLWDQSYITWYLDGVAVARIDTPADMHKDMYLIVSMGGGGAWPGPLAADFQSASLQVDSVKIYTLDSTSAPGVTLTAGLGPATLTGHDGADTLIGGPSADVLDGGAGADLMIGGLGDDHYTVNNPGDQVRELAFGGTDLVDSDISYTLPAFVENLHLIGNADLTGRGNELDNQITGNWGDNAIYGLDGDDVLTGGQGLDTLYGGRGDDTYVINTWYFDGSDKIVEQPGEGTDTVVANIDFTLPTNVENLVMLDGAGYGQGNASDNRITGAAGAEHIWGWGGDDVLIGGQGADTIDGGDGADVIYGDNVSGDTTGGDDVLNGGNGDDTLWGGYGADSLSGSWGNDTLYGNQGNDTIDGGAGDDWMHGGQGDDILFGGDGNDTLNGGVGADVLHGGAGADLLYGNENNDVLWGDDGDDWMHGGQGDDVLHGGAGNDTLNGGVGNDVLWGEGGADTFVFAAGFGRDVVRDFVAGDHLLFGPGTFASYDDVRAHMAQVGSDVVITLDAADTVTLTGVSLASLTHDQFVFG